MTEEETNRLWWHFSMFSLPKAIIIGFIAAGTVVATTGSYGKAAWIGGVALLLSFFTSWRRYLEPLAVLLFVGTAVIACIEPNVLNKIQGGVLAFASARSP